MKKQILLVGLILSLFILPLYGQEHGEDKKAKVAEPDLPRVSAYEAYLKYKAGKAIIIQSGGFAYEKRHVIGAYNLGSEDVRYGRVEVPNFPMSGMEIFIFCY
jgi:hypothetical protein